MAKRQRTRINSKIDQLPSNLKVQVNAMLLDTANTYESIADWLDSEGYPISKSAIGRYALRTNQAAQRVAETLERTKAIVAAVSDEPDIDFTRASRLVLMDGLMQRVSTAEEEFSEMPLDKAGRLIASLSRAESYEKKLRHDIKSKMELALSKFEDELMAKVKADPALAAELSALLERVRDQVLRDD
ncbi:DUF3486 family protein [Oscillospiraceae bacterium OttesenSCG-928-F05]|nr:DUF3486 family protein [Oscillospiraceae bacterium OttesenSCG-928-F05]